MITLKIFLLLLCIVSKNCTLAEENIRPYEFSFNLVDFQHRFEKQDEEGIVTGEFGFITADGVYHETGYATDKNGDFLITKMKNRKINSLKDAQEIFKDKPEVAKKLVEALERSCGSCKIPVKDVGGESTKEKIQEIIQKPILSVLTEKLIGGNLEGQNPNELLIETGNKGADFTKSNSEERTKYDRKGSENGSRDDRRQSKSVSGNNNLEGLAEDLYYRFNYSITTHDHHEAGYRSGNKDGGYRTSGENGVDSKVMYLSNEFGHQPNITFLPRGNDGDDKTRLHGYAFRWYWQ